MKNRAIPRATLARNLRYLLDREQLSEHQLAKRAGIAQKTVNNMLNQNGSPTLDNVDKVAAAFGLSMWHMILPDLPDELLRGNSIERLYRAYIDADHDGREHINRIAEREAEYVSKKNPQKDND
ncbi:helix-turn-helix domain-containing protein [Primorskyibacter sedentarius]|uniref:helix-turn-helix domain-containing protein n=1 Tax=Primorskyibacter sedentarius TaxID=745311 RepID=UPI003EB762CF